MSDWRNNIAAFMGSECDAILGPSGDGYTQEPVAVYAVAIARIEALTFQLAQRDAALKAADDLARLIHRTGYRVDHDGNTTLMGIDAMVPINDAIAAYRKARGQDA